MIPDTAKVTLDAVWIGVAMSHLGHQTQRPGTRRRNTEIHTNAHTVYRYLCAMDAHRN